MSSVISSEDQPHKTLEKTLLVFAEYVKIICETYEEENFNAIYTEAFTEWQAREPAPSRLRTIQTGYFYIEEFKMNLKNNEFVLNLNKDFGLMTSYNPSDQKAVDRYFYEMMDRILHGKEILQSDPKKISYSLKSVFIRHTICTDFMPLGVFYIEN